MGQRLFPQLCLKACKRFPQLHRLLGSTLSAFCVLPEQHRARSSRPMRADRSGCTVGSRVGAQLE